MLKTLDETRFHEFKKNLSSCVNIKSKTFYNKDLILSYSPIKKIIGFITKGKANIVKMDKEGNTTIMRDLKENDIFSNLFFQDTEDEIYIISNGETEVIFIDYYNIIKNCKSNCPFHKGNQAGRQKVPPEGKRSSAGAMCCSSSPCHGRKPRHRMSTACLRHRTRILPYRQHRIPNEDKMPAPC